MDLSTLYTTREAAEYLSMPKATLKQYVTRGLITPDKRSASILLFTRETLDRFKATERRPPGRPRKVA